MRSSGVSADGTLPLPGPRLTVPPVALMEADPEKFGDVLGPLPASVADGRDRVRPRGQRLAVEREAAGGELRVTLPDGGL